MTTLDKILKEFDETVGTSLIAILSLLKPELNLSDIYDKNKCPLIIKDIKSFITTVYNQAKEEFATELLNLPRVFWEDEDHAVGGYISKKDLKEKLLSHLTPIKSLKNK